MPTYTEEPLMAYRQRLICDCGAEMEYDGFYHPMIKPLFPHTCPKCKNSTTEDHSFPRIAYKNANE